jgi:hypothetical protein
MSNSRFALLGLVCLLVSACTVVLQPAPPVTEPETDVSVADPEPTLRPPVQQPRRRPANPDPPPGHVEPESPSQRPTPRTVGINLGIPPGHLPRPGECRVWVQGRPPGLQPRARTCHGILATAPVGSWILYRPVQYQRQIRVRYLHTAQQTIIAVRAFDAETGAYLRDFALAEDDDNMDPRATGVNRPTVGPTSRPTDNRGNGGNPPGRSGNAREGEKTTSNNGVAVGRADSTRSSRPTVGSADTTGNGGVTGGGRGIRARQTDTSDSRRARRGNIAVAVEQVDSTNERRPTKDTARVPVQSGVRGGAVTGGNGDVNEESPTDNAASPVNRNRNREDRRSASPVGSPLGIDSRYFPKLGQCRVWVPGLPSGRQARSENCDRISHDAPVGAWILRRPPAQPNVLLVDYMHDETAGLVARTSAFNPTNGAALHSAQMEPQ